MDSEFRIGEKVVSESDWMKDFFNEAIAGGAKQVPGDNSAPGASERAASWVYDDHQIVGK